MENRIYAAIDLKSFYP